MVKEIEVMEATKNGCDHNCSNCLMYLPDRYECYHITEKKWQEWNRKEHERFGRVLKGEL